MFKSNPAIVHESGADPTTGKGGNHRSRDQTKMIARILIQFCIKSALSLFAAWLISDPLIKAAAHERGYVGAYGGEWLLIIGTFVLTYYLISKGVDTHNNETPKS